MFKNSLNKVCDVVCHFLSIIFFFLFSLLQSKMVFSRSRNIVIPRVRSAFQRRPMISKVTTTPAVIVEPVIVNGRSSVVPLWESVEKSLEQPSAVYLLAACRDAVSRNNRYQGPHDNEKVNENLLRFVVDRAPDFGPKRTFTRTIPVKSSAKENTFVIKVQ
jgi:hypothetical protein